MFHSKVHQIDLKKNVYVSVLFWLADCYKIVKTRPADLVVQEPYIWKTSGESQNAALRTLYRLLMWQIFFY